PNAKWYDFWTGVSLQGGRAINAPAPIERLPLYVKAGSILPLGPDIEYAAEKAADPLEIRVYAGANGSFTLYEDENDTYNYEKGVFTTITLQWDEQSKTFVIGERNGSFPGMQETRTLRIVLVREGHGIGGDLAPQADRVVSYAGKKISVRFGSER